MPGAERDRLDRVLVARGLADTRARAQALVLAGRVRSGGVRLAKAGQLVPVDAPLEVEPGPRWASRGGTKLAHALEVLAVQVVERDVLDVGASTGGFTHVLLEAGARRVVALDVGRHQLDWTLRQEPRVHVLDGCNARLLTRDDLPFPVSMATVDVSFISLRTVLPPIVGCLDPPAEVLALVKPQFEVGRGRLGRGGIVRDPALHREVLSAVLDTVRAHGWAAQGVCASPVRGAQGNAEFFVLLRAHGTPLPAPDVEAQVDRALDEAGARS